MKTLKTQLIDLTPFFDYDDKIVELVVLANLEISKCFEQKDNQRIEEITQIINHMYEKLRGLDTFGNQYLAYKIYLEAIFADIEFDKFIQIRRAFGC